MEKNINFNKSVNSFIVLAYLYKKQLYDLKVIYIKEPESIKTQLKELKAINKLAVKIYGSSHNKCNIRVAQFVNYCKLLKNKSKSTFVITSHIC